MKRTFVETTLFQKNWKSLGLGDEELRILENTLLQNPQAGKVIRGTGKLRKIRIPLHGRGKSGGARVCYVDFLIFETIYLIDVYAKNEKENLTKAERNEIKKVIELIEKELGGENND